jgi:hypothetical protein
VKSISRSHATAGVINMQQQEPYNSRSRQYATAGVINMQQQESSTCNSRSYEHATAEFRHKPEPRKSRSNATTAAAIHCMAAAVL